MLNRPLCIVGLVLVAGCAQAETIPAHDEATDRAAVEALIEAERQANLDGDVDAFMALRAPDFTAMPPGMAPVRGAAVRDFIAQSVQEGIVTELHFTTADLRIDGDLAVARVIADGTMQFPDGGQMNAGLDFLFVARRMEGGQWSWLYLAWNVFPEE